MYRSYGPTKTDQGEGISVQGRKKETEKCSKTRKTTWIRKNEGTSAPGSPHIVVIVVIELDVVAKGRVSILPVVARVVSVAIFIAMLTTPSLALVAVVRIVVVVVHGFIVGTIPILLLFLGLPSIVSHLAPHKARGSTYFLVSLVLQVLIRLVTRLGRPL